MTFEFTFADGAKAAAVISAKCPEDKFPVTYSGAFERLPQRPPRAEVYWLDHLSKDLAAQLGAALEVRYQGQYDYWIA